MPVMAPELRLAAADMTQRTRAFRQLAQKLDGIDIPVYRQFGHDPLAPILCNGDPATRVAFFGRDPGRDEVRYQRPFIGAGGQKIRGAIHEHLYGNAMPDFAASLEVEHYFFWANTLPYKPVGNRAWPMGAKKGFQPLVADLLIHAWQGSTVITLGREAFFWFAINQGREVKERLERFWSRDDRFAESVEVELCAPTGVCRRLTLYPLPHPSPLNATWYRLFPDLLGRRLRQLHVATDNWRLGLRKPRDGIAETPRSGGGAGFCQSPLFPRPL